MTDDKTPDIEQIEPAIDQFEKDFFPLALAMDYLMEQYGMPSHYFLSNMFSEAKKSVQLQVVINALERFKRIEIQGEAPERVVEIEKDNLPEKLPKGILPDIRQYDVILTEYSVDELLKRIHAEGLGDWCVVDQKLPSDSNVPIEPIENIGTLQDVNSPILYIVDINTNKEYTLTKKKLMESVNEIWVDFPWAVNKGFNSDLEVSLLSKQDIDEIIQVAVLDEFIYEYPW